MKRIFAPKCLTGDSLRNCSMAPERCPHCQRLGSSQHPHLSIASATPDLAAALCCVSPTLPIAFAIAEEIEVRHVWTTGESEACARRPAPCCP